MDFSRRRFPAVAVLIPLCAVHALGATARAASYRPVFLEPPAGARQATIYGMDGDRPVGSVSVGVAEHAALFTPDLTGFVDLHPVTASRSRATGGGGGQQVGEADGLDPVVWSGSRESVVYLPKAGSAIAAVTAANGTRQVGRATKGAYAVYHAILWDGSGDRFVDLQPAGFSDSDARSMDGTRQVGAGGWRDGNNHALLWSGTADSAVDIHPGGLGYHRSAAWAISGDQIVGWATRPPDIEPWHAALWDLSDNRFIDLDPGGRFGLSAANYTNGDVQLGSGGGHALLWDDTPQSVVDLHLLLGPGYSQSNAVGIDSAGAIYGTAYRSDGTDRPVKWVLVPEPSAAALLAAAAAGALTHRPKRTGLGNQSR